MTGSEQREITQWHTTQELRHDGTKTLNPIIIPSGSLPPYTNSSIRRVFQVLRGSRLHQGPVFVLLHSESPGNRAHTGTCVFVDWYS